MKYTDVRIGQTVLYNWHRHNHRFYKFSNSVMATVAQTYVEHRYQVTTGGWDYRTETRHTDQGIRLRYIDHEGVEQETVTTAAHLIAAEGEALERWNRLQQKKREADEREARRDAEFAALQERLSNYVPNANISRHRPEYNEIVSVLLDMVEGK